MNYIVVDFEWNQAMSSNSSVFNKLPVHLRGEIIEIGAVKLDEHFRPTEEFSVDIKPVYFKRMHHRVKKITGFDKERLDHGQPFPKAFESFRAWCGEDVTFLTWGCDDQGIFEQNIIIHDLDWDWIREWVNLQLIYNVQTGGDRNQKALSTAMEHFEIEQTRIAHDALGDAYNTALVASHLDMPIGLMTYEDAPAILAERTLLAKEVAEQVDPDCLSHDSFTGLVSKAAAFTLPEIAEYKCPECGVAAPGLKWVNQGDQKYVNIYTCPSHGAFLCRLKFRKNLETNTFSAIRLSYKATADSIDAYKSKAAQIRRRGRSHYVKKNRPANKVTG